jgi:hypothetical protein
MRIVNLAHGSYFLLGSYVALSVIWTHQLHYCPQCRRRALAGLMHGNHRDSRFDTLKSPGGAWRGYRRERE